MIQLSEAVSLAVEAHRRQEPDEDDFPHIIHCMEVMLKVKTWCQEHTNKWHISYSVERALAKYSFENLLVGAILHDSVEDSKGIVTLENIREKFGEDVYKLVDGLTRRGTGEEKEFYRDFIYRVKKDPGCTLIKLSDLEHNQSRAFFIKQAKWRDKLRYKYSLASQILSNDDQITWEHASMTWVQDDKSSHFYIADPNGNKIEISAKNFDELWKNKVDRNSPVMAR